MHREGPLAFVICLYATLEHSFDGRYFLSWKKKRRKRWWWWWKRKGGRRKYGERREFFDDAERQRARDSLLLKFFLILSAPSEVAGRVFYITLYANETYALAEPRNKLHTYIGRPKITYPRPCAATHAQHTLVHVTHVMIRVLVREIRVCSSYGICAFYTDARDGKLPFRRSRFKELTRRRSP